MKQLEQARKFLAKAAEDQAPLAATVDTSTTPPMKAYLP